MIITKTFSFDMAHMLDGHDGKCNNLHGHTYQLKVALQGNVCQTGAKSGMIRDYGDIKQCVKMTILDFFDHAFVYDETREIERQIATLLANDGRKIYRLTKRTTAENISQVIFRLLKSHMPELTYIELFETQSSSCIYGEVDEK
ncbi:6-carboxy-5,6,7,8-tetrahydropterin synthase [Lactococcus hodotermopsidis]|uniref:6-carboxy-5,6,7,8-tetrahydropterin synthase n=1 Tax=Pseudolactococcus hodotermopsidis TaxID=2709157 RepID=A0A6A0BAN2_9LACT|nr:6-carboxytetrahydropterin synthase QueD [Lactococcus hodotermopsidis]GFH41705.1 6-carboxy-5,6,7,8-tetrahydropterin synthase [Lactococcus hodotermopsidis]